MMNPTKQKILENILYIFFYTHTHTHTHTKQPSMSNQTDDKQKLIKNLSKTEQKNKTKKKEHKE